MPEELEKRDSTIQFLQIHGEDDEVITPKDGKKMARLFEDFTYFSVENLAYGVPSSKFASSSSSPGTCNKVADWMFERFPNSDEVADICFANIGS